MKGKKARTLLLDALCMLAGCYGGSRAVTSVLLDMVTITVGTSSPGAKAGGVVGNNDGTVYDDCECDGTVTVEGDKNQIPPIGGGDTSLAASEGGQQSAAVAG